MRTDYYKNGKLVYSYEHGNGASFECVKESVPKIMCKIYPGVDEAITVSKTKGSFKTKLEITQNTI